MNKSIHVTWGSIFFLFQVVLQTPWAIRTPTSEAPCHKQLPHSAESPRNLKGTTKVTGWTLNSTWISKWNSNICWGAGSVFQDKGSPYFKRSTLECLTPQTHGALLWKLRQAERSLPTDGQSLRKPHAGGMRARVTSLESVSIQGVHFKASHPPSASQG